MDSYYMTNLKKIFFEFYTNLQKYPVALTKIGNKSKIHVSRYQRFILG